MPPRGTPSREQLERWLERHGTHTTSYVLLEGRKRYLTAPDVDGFLAFERRLGVPIVAGDPVAPLEEAARLLRALRRAHWPRPSYAYAASAAMLTAFRAAGFGAVPVGAEPTFDPRRFSLGGGARATVRAAVNHARRDGLGVEEHDPHAPDAAATNRELETISAEWLREKGRDELGFLLGQPMLDQRTRKRYFVARSAHRVEGFLVCEPVLAGGGWYLDVTRRRADASRGTMELLTTSALLTFGAEGVAFASMGLAPLAQLETGDSSGVDSPALRALLAEAYRSLDTPYDVRNLYRYKSKYAPDSWTPRYFCFSRGPGEWLAKAVLRAALWRERRRRGAQPESAAPQDVQ